MKALKVTINGTYRNSDNEIFDYDNLSGIVPVITDKQVLLSHLKARCVKPWIKNAVDAKGKKLYPDRIEDERTTYIDDVQEIEVEADDEVYSFIGKDIKKMSKQELQNLAMAKDLRVIPNEIDDLQPAREIAYVAYADMVGFGKIDRNKEGFDFSALPMLVVESGSSRIDTSQKPTLDEQIQKEQETKQLTTLTYEELVVLAKDKGIQVPTGIAFDDLYKLVYTQK